jgi:hypothetical protein
MHQKESHTLSYPSADLQPSDWLRFVQLDPFAKKWSKLGLLDDDLRALEVVIMSLSDRAPVVQGTGGLRKVRLSQESSNRSKRDSFRVCYALFPDYGIVLLITVFGKNEKSNLSAADRNAIAKVIKAIQEQLDQGTIR